MKFAIGGVIGAGVFALALFIWGPVAAFIGAVLVLLITIFPALGIFIAAPIALIVLWIYDVSLTNIILIVAGTLLAIYVLVGMSNVKQGKPWNHGMSLEEESPDEKGG